MPAQSWAGVPAVLFLLPRALQHVPSVLSNRPANPLNTCHQSSEHVPVSAQWAPAGEGRRTARHPSPGLTWQLGAAQRAQRALAGPAGSAPLVAAPAEANAVVVLGWVVLVGGSGVSRSATQCGTKIVLHVCSSTAKQPQQAAPLSLQLACPASSISTWVKRQGSDSNGPSCSKPAQPLGDTWSRIERGCSCQCA